MGHTKVRCTKPLVEDEESGIGDNSHGDGFGASGGANDGGGDFSTSNYEAEAASATAAVGGDWGASTGGSVNW